MLGHFYYHFRLFSSFFMRFRAHGWAAWERDAAVSRRRSCLPRAAPSRPLPCHRQPQAFFRTDQVVVVVRALVKLGHLCAYSWRLDGHPWRC